MEFTEVDFTSCQAVDGQVWPEFTWYVLPPTSIETATFFQGATREDPSEGNVGKD